MHAYKFLFAGRVGPFSDFTWPLDQWVQGSGDACVGGVHACRLEDLPYWIDKELWVVQLEGPVQTGVHKVVAPRGRLVQRVAAWDTDNARQFALACVGRARDEVAALVAPELAQVLTNAPVAELLRALPPLGTHPACDRLRDAAGCLSGSNHAVTSYCAAHAGGTREAYIAARKFQGEWFRKLLV